MLLGLFSIRLTVDDVADARSALTARGVRGRPLEITVADPSLLRALTINRRPPRRTRDLTLVVHEWLPPVTGWRGQARLADADSFEIRYDRPGRTATARIRFDKEFEVADIVRRLIGAFTPTTRLMGAGFPRIAFDEEIGDDAVRLLGRHAAEHSAAPPRVLAGVGLASADVVVADGHRETDPDEMLSVIGVARALTPSHERARSVARDEIPLVDLSVHNPIGRIQQYEPETKSASLQSDGGELVLRVTDEPAEREVRMAVGAPVPRAVVRELTDVEAISLEDLVIDQAVAAHIDARLAEVAATGTILHDLPEVAAAELTQLHPRLVELMRLPYARAVGLAREQRSVAQRRVAMRSHAGYLHLAEQVAAGTAGRSLPRVSVVLSTVRPHRVSDVLALLLAQTYPDFEIVLALHGCDPEVARDFDRFVDTGLVRVLERPASQPFGSVLADAVRASSGDLVMKVDDDDWYSPNVLWDLVLAYLYSGADLVGKTTEYLYFERIHQTVHRTFATERYHRQLAGGAMMLPRAVLDSMGGWRPTRHSTDRSVLLDAFRSGGIGYRTHGLGYLYIRHDDGHTWVRSESLLLENSFEQWRGLVRPEVLGAETGHRP
ncbi:glycosyltransferase [Microbacter sp. GSS18]|nr:glycosyltransferase [Microbacter sp. GSS18]